MHDLLYGIPFLSTRKLRFFHAAAAVKLFDDAVHLKVKHLG
jgi:hypothetical protein